MIVSTDHHRNAECGMRNAECSFPHHASRITHHASRHAFTLLELLAVISIMGIVAALSLPTLRGLRPNAKVAATRDLLDAVGRARQLAVSQRTTVYMVFLAQQTNVQPLLDKQLTGYAYVSLRSVGDQPGKHYAHYLSPWRTLPKGAFIPPAKFTTGFWMTNIYLGTEFNPGLWIAPLPMTNNIPFPSEDNPVSPPVWLPYIAFNGMGELVSGAGRELIPLTEGNVSFARDATTKEALAQPAQVSEVPAGNTSENYSLVYIDRLTGRARVERRKAQ